jgi:histidinol-phosphate/aromatic aminotransferase/cobyric acid decarboxylase-like protein
MKKLAIIAASLAALSGCATYYPAPAYATRGYGQADANGWQVVSVTPVAPGTGAANGNAAVVSSAPVYADPVYAPAPVYGAPVYAAPVYGAPVYDPFWYPPISIGLGFSWSHWSGGHGYHGGYHGGGRHR